jgi:hypothetical protein
MDEPEDLLDYKHTFKQHGTDQDRWYYLGTDPSREGSVESTLSVVLLAYDEGGNVRMIDAEDRVMAFVAANSLGMAP